MTTLYDHRGQPIDTRVLQEEQAGPSVGSRPATRTPIADGINPKRLARLLRQTDAGDALAFVTLADEMEERDLHYFSVLSTRKLGVSSAPRVVEAATDKRRDKKIADDVRENVVKAPGFAALVFDLLDGLGKGFSVCEIDWKRDASRFIPRGYEFRTQRWFQFDKESQTKLRIRSSDDPNGIELAPYRFAVHMPRLRSGVPIRSGLARMACVAWMMKRFTLADWMTFLDVFGMPLRIGRFDTTASKEHRQMLLSAVRSLGPEAAAILPKGMDIEIKEASRAGGGDKVFAGMADYLDQQVSKGVLGQTMTTDNGSSLSQAQVHNEVRLEIKASDAEQLEATIQRDVINPFVALNYGADVVPPKFRIPIAAPEDQEKKAKTFQVLTGMGVRIQESWLRDQFGIPDPDEGAEVVGGKAQAPANPAPNAPDPAVSAPAS